jgi:hypothetical protein
MKARAIEDARLRRQPAGPPGNGLFAAAVAWSLAWKGVSLWQAARDRSKPWFVILLVTNTLGILDAVYLFGVSRARRGPADRTRDGRDRRAAAREGRALARDRSSSWSRTARRPRR